MRVVVLGSGVIGVTTAWYLAEAGHEVEVVDRQVGPALETSFANAGEISPGYASPWARQDMPLKALKWLFHKNSPPGLPPQPGSCPVALDPADAAQLHSGPLSPEQEPYGADRRIQP